jgi:outer membrane protein assembly factor BamB
MGRAGSNLTNMLSRNSRYHRAEPDLFHLAAPPGGILPQGTDGYFYALDAGSGELLWRMSLAGEITSGPMTYSIAGKQYVTVAAGNILFAFSVRQ